jgi:hypothetical protein
MGKRKTRRRRKDSAGASAGNSSASAGDGRAGEAIDKPTKTDGETIAQATQATRAGDGRAGDSDQRESKRMGIFSMNTIDINADALSAEAAAVLAEAEPVPVDPVEGQGAPVATAAQSWQPVVEGLAPTLAVIVFPQWELSPSEVETFGKSLTECLDQLFPGGVEGKYACYARLLAVTAGICATRYMKHGELPPLGPKKIEPPKDAPRKTADIAA